MLFKILQIAVPFIWFGAVGAISFLETPLKFRAPNITLALGLGIGKIVFQALNRLELVFAALMLVSLFFAPPGSFELYVFGAIFALLLLQTVRFLPALQTRAEQVIGGIPAPASKNHLIFIAVESIKFLLLLILGASLLRNNLRFE